MIVIEGIDNSGKSTLARQISAMLPTWRVQVSEGPPKFTGEINERIKRYLGEHNVKTIYDRHPCVSQPIYNSMRGNNPEPVSIDLTQSFYDMRPLLIYCDPNGRGLDNYQPSAIETPEHVVGIRDNYFKMLRYYREWAIDHATIVYRIGDPMTRVLRMIESLTGSK